MASTYQPYFPRGIFLSLPTASQPDPSLKDQWATVLAGQASCLGNTGTDRSKVWREGGFEVRERSELCFDEKLGKAWGREKLQLKGWGLGGFAALTQAFGLRQEPALEAASKPLNSGGSAVELPPQALFAYV